MKILENVNLNNKKNLLLGVLVIGILSMTIAFAIFTTRLTLDGNANIAATRWNIHFDNWQKVSIPTVTVGGNTQTNNAQSPAVNQLTMQDNSNVTKVSNVNITLNEPGDIAKYTFDIVNDGTLDAKLSDFTYNITCNSGNNCNVINLDVECKDAISNGNTISTNYVLRRNTRVYCSLEVKYKEQTNTNTPGTNQTYNKDSATSDITAVWIWVQNSTDDTLPDPDPVPISKCVGGQMINSSNWCLSNPGADLKLQKFIYYNGDTAWSPGWHELTDLYGITQEYYADNDGFAHVGWLTWNNNKYFLSDEDDDGNGYVNANLIKNTVKTIDNKCYSFDENGVATENGPGCSSGSDTYNYVGIGAKGTPYSGNEVDSDWVAWVKKNTTTGVKEVCQKFENGVACLEQNKQNDSAYIQQKMTEFENASGESCYSDGETPLSCGVDSIEFGEIYYPDVSCFIENNGRAVCENFGSYTCELGQWDIEDNYDPNYIGCNELTISN